MQPVEFTKITICLALAQFLSSESFSFYKTNKLAVLAAILGLPVMLIFIQNDTGSALVFFAFVFDDHGDDTYAAVVEKGRGMKSEAFMPSP